MPAGRPSTYSDAIAAAICARIAEGESLRSICRDPEMPGLSTVFQWLPAHPQFADQYAQAQAARAEALADEICAIADGESEDVNRDRLRVDARKWVASRLLPKKYGDRVVNEHTGKDGGPIQTESLSELELARRIAFALVQGEKAGE